MLHHIGSLLAYSSELFKGMCSTHNRVECMTTLYVLSCSKYMEDLFCWAGVGATMHVGPEHVVK